MDVIVATKNRNLRPIILLSIPLILSAFTHLWNLGGFPYLVGDEGHYIRRALFFLEQLDPQEGARYDHPYFGQIFLASLFKLVGYPFSLNPHLGDIYSTQMLYTIPRVLMGLLAVVDTFLIYKICENRYNNNNLTIAFIASILFAVMPLTWLTRRVYLDSIQLPFLLSSILFAVYYNKMKGSQDENIKKILLISSGLFMGLAIFTKLPVIAMIPLVGYLIFIKTGRNKSNGTGSSTKTEGIRRSIETLRTTRTNLKALGLWFIPVFLIPAIWPAYAISIGEFDNWYEGAFSQAAREGSGIQSINILYKIDPVLVTIALVGFVYAIIIKRDLLLLLWIIPFLIFHALVPWTQHFHWLQAFPAFCIAAAVMIDDLANRFGKKRKDYRSLEQHPPNEYTFSIRKTIVRFISFRQLYNGLKRNFVLSSKALAGITVACIAIFGLVSTTMLIATNINSSFFELVTFLTQYLPEYRDPHSECIWCPPIPTENINDNKITNKNNKATMIGNAWIFGTFWMPKFVYQKDNDFKGFFTKGLVNTKKVLIVADRDLLDTISVKNPPKNIKQLQGLYKNAKIIATFNETRPRFDGNAYPYQSMSENRGIGKIVIKANY